MEKVQIANLFRQMSKYHLAGVISELKKRIKKGDFSNTIKQKAEKVKKPDDLLDFATKYEEVCGVTMEIFNDLVEKHKRIDELRLKVQKNAEKFFNETPKSLEKKEYKLLKTFRMSQTLALQRVIVAQEKSTSAVSAYFIDDLFRGIFYFQKRAIPVNIVGFMLDDLLAEGCLKRSYKKPLKKLKEFGLIDYHINGEEIYLKLNFYSNCKTENLFYYQGELLEEFEKDYKKTLEDNANHLMPTLNYHPYLMNEVYSQRTRDHHLSFDYKKNDENWMIFKSKFLTQH